MLKDAVHCFLGHQRFCGFLTSKSMNRIGAILHSNKMYYEKALAL
jgi:hypothetical protein